MEFCTPLECSNGSTASKKQYHYQLSSTILFITLNVIPVCFTIFVMANLTKNKDDHPPRYPIIAPMYDKSCTPNVLT